MWDSFTKFDLNILLYVQEHFRTETLTFLMQQITSLGSIFLALVALWLILKGSNKERLFGIIMVVSVLIEVAIVNGFLKNFIARPRPFNVSDEILPAVDILSDYSFPSGHTALAFAMAFVFYRYLPKKYGIPAIIIASFVGLSRVQLGVHYLSDVIGGIIFAYISTRIAEYLVYKYHSNRIENDI
jgi:undecaprenyl-diphosphatase